MTEQLREIGIRLSALREMCDITISEMARKLEIPEEEYAAYENGDKDFSFSFLYSAAGVLKVDVLDIISGESPKLSTCCLVRKGGGFEIQRRKAYKYKHLAFTFRNKKAEPFLVTVEAKEDDEKPVLHSHEGQEFNYMVSGSMMFYIGDMEYELNEGDSVYFNSDNPHAMKAMGGRSAEFIAVVLK